MSKNVGDYALIVGVSHYKSLRVLEGPEEDAREFQTWLLDKNGGNLPVENCHLILSEIDATAPLQETIDDHLESILEKVTVEPGRRFYFYFSGHGIGIEWNMTALVLPKWTEKRRNAALSGMDYNTMLTESGTFEQIFFFLDCCRNVKISVTGAKPQLGNIDPSSNTGSVSSYIFSATEFGNKAYEAQISSAQGSLPDSSQTRGLFTESLIRGLQGAAEMDGRITTLSLSQYLLEDLPKLVKQKVNIIQKPQLIANDNGTGITILDNIKRRDIVLQISFLKEGSDVVLLNPSTEKSEYISSRSKPWLVKVHKGTYIIYYKNDFDSMKVIEIAGNKNTVDYEF